MNNKLFLFWIFCTICACICHSDDVTKTRMGLLSNDSKVVTEVDLTRIDSKIDTLSNNTESVTESLSTQIISNNNMVVANISEISSKIDNIYSTLTNRLLELEIGRITIDENTKIVYKKMFGKISDLDLSKLTVKLKYNDTIYKMPLISKETYDPYTYYTFRYENVSYMMMTYMFGHKFVHDINITVNDTSVYSKSEIESLSNYSLINFKYDGIDYTITINPDDNIFADKEIGKIQQL